VDQGETMNQTKELERLALTAHQRGESWAAFWERHGNAVQQAEPWNARQFKRLYDRLLALVCSGDTAGMEPLAIAEPWLQDDCPAPVSDTITAARCLWTPEVKHD
jgi:hypothetical protein